MRFMRSLARDGSALTHESRELEFALLDPESPTSDSQRKLNDEVRARPF